MVDELLRNKSVSAGEGQGITIDLEHCRFVMIALGLDLEVIGKYKFMLFLKDYK